MQTTNSIGRYSAATEFVPLFEHKPKQFVPLQIKRVDYEDTEIKTQESPGSASTETQSGFTPQDQQATTPKT